MSYFYGKKAAGFYATTRGCNYNNIIANNGSVVENKDGTVSVFTSTGPLALNKFCCEVMKVGYTFNVDTQKCMWSMTIPTISTQSIQTTTPCTLDSFKLTLNPNGNNGSMFYVNDGGDGVQSIEKCSLDIEFDYLIKINCDYLTNVLNGTTTAKPMATTVVQTTQLLSDSQKTQCEALAKKIAILKETIATTSYSITCTQDVPSAPQVVTQTALQPFTRTGFGLYEFDLANYATETLCLTDAGLNQWSTILGSRYNSFLAGDPSSYTCVDFNKLKEVNAGGDVDLFFVCTTPFGTKTTLLSQLKQLQSQYDGCVKASTVTTTTLAAQETVVTTEENTCGTPIDVIENLDISVTLDYVDSTQNLVTVATYPLLPSIGTGNLYSYLNNNKESGFLVCGEPNVNEIANGITGCTPIYLDSTSTDNVFACSNLINSTLDGLFTQSNLDKATFDASFNKNALASNWLHYKAVVSDEAVLSQIANKNIKITIKVNSSCGEFCILLDNIKLNKVCTLIAENNMFISSSPGFELTRVIDNKKSWLANTTPQNRPFSITNVPSTNSIRQTNYDVNDERLVINTKEIDLDIDIASAIETDVWCYIYDNPCLLTATTMSNCGCSSLGCFKDSFNIKDYKDSELFNDLEDLFVNIRAQRNAWYKAYNERALAVGPYFTVKDSPYSSVINDDLTLSYLATKVAYEKSNNELSISNGGYIFGFNDKPNLYQFLDEPVPQILKTDCGDVMTIMFAETAIYYVSNELDELEIYVQDISGIVEPTNTLVSYTSLINKGNVNNADTYTYIGTPQLYCTYFGNHINSISAYRKAYNTYEVNSNVDTKNNGNAFNNADTFFVRWDSTKNKCMARNTQVFPEAFSLNFLKQDYTKFCKGYHGVYSEAECIAKATGDKTYYTSATIITTFVGDTLYSSSGNYVISGISDTSLINVGTYIYGDGVTWNSRVVSVGVDSITLDRICTITASGVTLENWSDSFFKPGELKTAFYRQFRDSNLKLVSEIILGAQRNYSTSVINLDGTTPTEPYTGSTAPYYNFIPVDVTTTIKMGSIDGPIVYKESYRLNDPSSSNTLGRPNSLGVGLGLAELKIPIGIAYSGGFQYNSDPKSTNYSSFSNEIPFGTYITGSTSGLPFFDSGNNTADAIDYVNEYYVHLDIVDTSGNTYYATNNDFNLKDSNCLIKFPTSASTQTLDINSLISSIDNKKQEFLDARDVALNIIVKNGGCVNC